MAMEMYPHQSLNHKQVAGCERAAKGASWLGSYAPGTLRWMTWFRLFRGGRLGQLCPNGQRIPQPQELPAKTIGPCQKGI
eukprot:5314713-Karenia_brevis.AAC.1